MSYLTQLIYPQQPIIALWDDVMPTINKTRPPEPLVMRMTTFDCVKYFHTNLVPEVFELDDYQVRTRMDIIGQHIHLPKLDLTTTFPTMLPHTDGERSRISFCGSRED